LASEIVGRATRYIDENAGDDEFWCNRERVLRVVHEEYVDDKILDQLSVEDVLKLRTVPWGEQAEAREELMQSAASLAKEAMCEADYDGAIRDRIRKYREKVEAVEHERKQLNFRVNCDVAKGILGVAAAAPGLVAALQTSIGVGTTLLAGCIYAVERFKEHGPAFANLKQAEAEFESDAAYGINNYYSRIGNLK
jgi:hypothetical protein